MSECDQLIAGNIRSVQMGGPAGSMVPTPLGEQQITDIWNTTCAPSEGPWGGDFNLFRQAIIDEANTGSTDVTVEANFQTAATINDARATANFGSFIPAMLFCIDLWWLKIYIWRTI